MGTPRRAGPPYGLPAQATTQGGQFWTPIGGQYSTPVDTQTAAIENGFVYIPETAPWLAEYLHEMTVFPNGKHDDQVDSTAQFLDWFKRPFPGQGIYEYYRRRAQELEEQRKPQPVKTVWARGSMQWQAEQEKEDRTAASAPEPLSLADGRAAERAN